MPSAINLSITKRRAVLCSLAAFSTATTLGGMSRPAEPGNCAASADRKIIELCRQFDALQEKIHSFYMDGPYRIDDDDERDEVIEPFTDLQADLLDEICTLQAVTPEGHRARAQMFARYMPLVTQKASHGHCWDERMIAVLVRDLIENA